MPLQATNKRICVLPELAVCQDIGTFKPLVRDLATAPTCAPRRFKRLTIITNALSIATELTSSTFEVILLGGFLRPNSLSLVGPITEDQLREYHADLLFLGVDGFDRQVGLTTPNVLESRVNRAMLRASDKVIAVCDSTKFNRRSHSRIAEVTAVHHVITDSALGGLEVEAIRSLGIGVTLV